MAGQNKEGFPSFSLALVARAISYIAQLGLDNTKDEKGGTEAATAAAWKAATTNDDDDGRRGVAPRARKK